MLYGFYFKNNELLCQIIVFENVLFTKNELRVLMSRKNRIFAPSKKQKRYEQNDCLLRGFGADGLPWRLRTAQLPMQEMRHADPDVQHAVVAQLSRQRVAQLAEPRRDRGRKLLLQEMRHLGDEPQPAQFAGLPGREFALLEPPRPRGPKRLPMQEMRPRDT